MDSERLKERFLRYVACASESYHERTFCLAMEKELTAMGLEWERQEIGEAFDSNGWNLHAHLPGQGVPLLLSAHLDTVSPGSGITPVIRHGVVYSDGTTILAADDKAGIAAALEAIQTLQEGQTVHRPVELLLTVCEEVGMLGAQFADYSQIVSKEAVVLDSERVGSIVNQTAAHIRLHFTVLGKSAHAGVAPEEGIHALKAAAEAVTRIDCGWVSDHSVVNVANFSSPGQTNIVPEQASFDVEIRSFSEEELQQLRFRVCASVETACAAYGAKFRCGEDRVSNAVCVPADSPVVRKVCAAMRALGVEPVMEKTLGGSDVTRLVENGLTAVNLGVGMQAAHSCREHICLQELETITKILIHVLRA